MKRLIIGEVLKPQGIRGELKVKTYTDFPEDVKEFGTVYIDDMPYIDKSAFSSSVCQTAFFDLNSPTLKACV